MRNSRRLLLVLIALGIASGVAAAAARQQPPRVGGYREVAASDPEVVSAAEFAVRAQARKEGNAIQLVSVESAERQTVAGANYRLCLTVEVEDEENNVVVTQGVRAVVFRSLKKEYSLRSWQEEDCGEDD